MHGNWEIIFMITHKYLRDMEDSNLKSSFLNFARIVFALITQIYSLHSSPIFQLIRKGILRE